MSLTTRQSRAAPGGSSSDGTVQPVRRRRGAALEKALLDAAWSELAEKGYAGLTYEGVAERAATSRAVIYRRWPTKPDLTRAAAIHGGRVEKPEPIDTGSLRGDLIEMLMWANRTRVRVSLVMANLAEYFTETSTAPADLRSAFIADREPQTEVFYQRAVERGEIRADRLTPRAKSLAFDLFRGELLMTLKPLPAETIESIVDEVVMPLLTR